MCFKKPNHFLKFPLNALRCFIIMTSLFIYLLNYVKPSNILKIVSDVERPFLASELRHRGESNLANETTKSRSFFQLSKTFHYRRNQRRKPAAKSNSKTDKLLNYLQSR